MEYIHHLNQQKEIKSWKLSENFKVEYKRQPYWQFSRLKTKNKMRVSGVTVFKTTFC